MTLTELEEELSGSEGVSVRDEIMARLADMEHRFRTQAASGMPRNKYSDCLAALDAVVAAREIIVQWQSEGA